MDRRRTPIELPRIASTVSPILAFTAELFVGVPGVGQKVDACGLTVDLYHGIVSA